jgi:hypothetical protein
MTANELKKVAKFSIDERTQLFELAETKATLKAAREHIDDIIKAYETAARRYIDDPTNAYETAAAIARKHSIINYNSCRIEVQGSRVWLAVEGVSLTITTSIDLRESMRHLNTRTARSR